MRDIVINLDQKKGSNAFVESFTSPIPITDAYEFYRSDSFPIRLQFVREQTQLNTVTPFFRVDPATFASVKFGAGILGATPDGGTFILTELATAFPTSAIAYNASAATVQAALRAIGGGSYGSCVVTGNAGGPYLIDRVTLGVNLGLSGDATALSPDGSTVVVVETQVGSAFLSEKIQVRLAKALPILKTTGWTALPSALVATAVVQVGSGTANKTFSLTWNADAEGGAVILSFTGDTTTGSIGPIPFNATASEVARAFETPNHIDVEVGGMLVVQNGPGSYTLTCVGTGIKASNTPALATSSNTLLVPVGYTGVITVSTAGADDILAGEDSADIFIEVEVAEASGQPKTFQTTGKLLADGILNTPGQRTGEENFLTGNTGVNFYSGVSGYIGGGATKLDGVVTANLTVPLVAQFLSTASPAGLHEYILVAGVDAESSPNIVRPDDYDGSTNAKVWVAQF